MEALPVSFGVSAGPYLAAAAMVAVLLGFAWQNRWRRRRLRALAEAGPGPARLVRMIDSLARRRRYLGQLLLALAAGLLTLAASGPRVPGHSVSDQRGIDIVLVLDYSASMLAEDVHPSRLEQMVRAVEGLIDRLPSSRIGVVAFAGAATHFPLTHDHEAARGVFRGLRASDLPPGSNLGEALRVARCLARPGRADDPDCGGIGGRGRGGAPLAEGGDGGRRTADAPGPAPDKRDERGRALVIFTDGEETDGDGTRQLSLATRLGLEVYLVAVGTVRGGWVPELDPRGLPLGRKLDADGEPVRSRLDLNRLGALAQLAGGEERLYTIGLEGRPVTEIPEALEGLQQGVLRVQSVRRYRGVFEWFAFPGFLLLLVEAVMSLRRRRVLYPDEDAG